MSTREKEKQIAESLKQLNNPALSRFHNSLNISFRQMLDYIDKATNSIPPGDIKQLIATYRSMVEIFYTQFELTLLAAITKQKEVEEHANTALRCIEKLPNNHAAKAGLEQAISLLLEDSHNACLEHNRLKDDYPMLLQSALDKLRSEWQRLDALLVSNQVLTGDERLDRSLWAVVEVAAHSVGVEAERIAIVPGNAFALNFFTYLDNFAVLTVPIYSVQSIWEWSIFWHELAGYRVRRLEKHAAIEAIRRKLIAFHDEYKVKVPNGQKSKESPDLIDPQNKELLDSLDPESKELLDAITWDNRFCKSYLFSIFSKERPNLDDLGGFEHQFERVVLGLTSADRFQVYDQIKAEGWCVDWFKELFEDAWSVLTIGEPFLILFEDVLARNPVKDTCHPPSKVRRSVAKEILKLVNPDTTLRNDDASLMEVLTAQQILKFVSLLRAAARQYKKPNQETDIQLQWQRNRDELFEKVRDGIQRSIVNWSEQFLMLNNPLRRVRSNAKDLVEILSDPNVEELISSLHDYEAGRIKASYKELLENRNYEQLLKLSFSEIDYHTPGDVQLLKNGITYWVKPVDWWSMIWSSQRHRVGNGILPTETIITEVNAHVDWKVNIADWNNWFKMTQ